MDEEIAEIRASAERIIGLNEYYDRSDLSASSIEDAESTKKELASIKKEMLRQTFEIKKALKKAEKKAAQNA